MEKFLDLFADLIRFSYHCFDRVVINGYLSSFARPANAVYFFREVKQEPVITKQVLRARTEAYVSWVEAYAKNQAIPIYWAKDKTRKKDSLERIRNKRVKQGFTGVYSILREMERSPNFRIAKEPKYPPPNDPNWRLLKKQWTPHKHYYFYLIDELLGPASFKMSTFAPFQATYWFNGHSLIAQALDAQGVKYKMRDNAFVWVEDPQTLQAAADAIDHDAIMERLRYWTFLLGPKFSAHEREDFDLRRFFYFAQVEYAHNIIFKSNAPLKKMFDRSCDLGLARINPKYMAQTFGWRITKRHKGKLHSVLDRIQEGHHTLRAYGRNSYFKRYQKFPNFLRPETCSNNVTDFRILAKGI